MVTLADRRQHKRNDIDWPVSVYHPRLGMFINGRSVDVSSGGAKITLPIAAPIKPGQVVELNFPRTTMLARAAGCYSRIKTAVVVRVDKPEPRLPGDAPVKAYGSLLVHQPKPSRRRKQSVAVQFDDAVLTPA
jgi:hypothetical protein